jgi:hypothetical protein
MLQIERAAHADLVHDDLAHLVDTGSRSDG